jgi:hypothetical protein
MNQYSLLVGKEVSQLVRNGARLQCIELMNFTWPTEKSHGEARIGKDVSKIFMSLNPNWFSQVVKSRTILRSGRSKKHNTARVSMFEDTQPVLKSISEVIDFHSKNRKFKRGKELPHSKKAIIKISVRNQLVKILQKKVGLCKAGWAVAASLCNADVRQPMRGIPQWVTRNMAKAVGSVREVKLTGMGFRIDTTNKIDYTSELLKKKYQDIARNIARDKFVKMMSSAIRATKLKEAGLK